ncbi:MAG: cytochrome c maturation protein CcmE [Myxococcales bacterium]|nr:cytochrome c maturation protein CcmE [Myxococcales bacterium]
MDQDTAPEPTEIVDDDESEGLNPLVKVGLIVGGFAAALALLVFGFDADKSIAYSKLVHEVVVEPEKFAGRTLRVEGDLKNGSVAFREEPCEWRFVLTKEQREMPVRFPQCIVPDTFKDGMGIQVTVQGTLAKDGSFLANQVIPRCPSKYEMQQKQANGEAAPHAMPATLPGMGS